MCCDMINNHSKQSPFHTRRRWSFIHQAKPCPNLHLTTKNHPSVDIPQPHHSLDHHIMYITNCTHQHQKRDPFHHRFHHQNHHPHLKRNATGYSSFYFRCGNDARRSPSASSGVSCSILTWQCTLHWCSITPSMPTCCP